MEKALTGLLAEGRLIQVLKNWCPLFPGYFSLLSQSSQLARRLTALIDSLRRSAARTRISFSGHSFSDHSFSYRTDEGDIFDYMAYR